MTSKNKNDKKLNSPVPKQQNWNEDQDRVEGPQQNHHIFGPHTSDVDLKTPLALLGNINNVT